MGARIGLLISRHGGEDEVAVRLGWLAEGHPLEEREPVRRNEALSVGVGRGWDAEVPLLAGDLQRGPGELDEERRV